jgi:hypothetical protein
MSTVSQIFTVGTLESSTATLVTTIFGTDINFETLETIGGLTQGQLEIEFICTGIDIKIEQKTGELGNLIYANSNIQVQATDPGTGELLYDENGNPIYVEPPQYEPNLDEPYYVYKVECTIEKHANIDNSLPETITRSLAPFDTGVTDLLDTIKTNLRGLIAEEYSTGSTFTLGTD